jgi:predicted SAM-dependent methyltransferase
MPYSLPYQAGQKIVELGGGDRPAFHPNVDVRAGAVVDVVADLGEPLPLPSEGYDGVYSSYALEHVSWRKVRGLISETARILKPGGRAVFITANLYEQARYIVEREREGWEDKDVCCIFGDQDYDDNTHRSGFSPEFAFRLFQDAGFSDILIVPYGELHTDMIIEAKKKEPEIRPELWTPKERREAYNRLYFDGGRGRVGGYAREGYRDFPAHWTTFRKVMEEKPESVLEIGSARGYVLKRLEDAGIRVKGLEVSEHCRLTRVVEDIVTWDITETPWPVGDKEFDLVFSIATLEHIPEGKIAAVAAEMRRVSRRGLHGIDFGHNDDGFDRTHCMFGTKSWWMGRLPEAHEVVNKEDLEAGPVEMPAGDGKVKLNIGSFTTMFAHGWYNLDLHPLGDWARANGFVYRQHDVRQGLPYAADTVDMVFAAHFLEHLTYDEGLAFLKECRRAMRPGGLMRLVFPDADLLSRMFLEGHLSVFDEINDGVAASPHQAGKLWALLFSGHQSTYDWRAIEDIFRRAGFTDFGRMGFRKSRASRMLGETLDLFADLSLFVEASK